MKYLLSVVVLCWSFQAAFADNHGVVKVPSAFSVAQTTSNLKNTLEKKKFKIFAIIDHSKNAENNGLTLTPNTLIIFGNPKVGTPLMQASASIGLDLPVKLHIYEANKKAYVSYNNPDFLAKRHGISKDKPQIRKMANALKKIVVGATSKSS